MSNNLPLLIEPQTLRDHLEGIDLVVVDLCKETTYRELHTWFVLHHLGIERSKGYPGSWSGWGNLDDTPKANP